MSKPEPNMIISLFHKTLQEYVDAFEAMTDLYDDGKIPEDSVLEQHMATVVRKRDKLLTCVKSARYYHSQDLGLVVPMIHLHGGFC